MNPTLPSVSGRMEMTHAVFQCACQTAILDLQEKASPDNHLIYLLTEAIRCSREACENHSRQRWIVEPTQHGVRICRGEHDKALACQWEYYKAIPMKEGDAPCPDATVTEGK